KRALMVVEPPGNFGRVCIFTIDDGVFIAIEEAGSPWLRSTMGHARDAELRGGIECFRVKAIKKSGRGGAIKTAIVEAQPDTGHVLAMAPFSFFLPCTAETKPFRLAGQ